MGAIDMTRVVTAAAICLVAAGCSDPRSASEDNFRKALEPMVADAFCTTIRAAILVPDGRIGDAVFPLTVATTEAPGAAWDPTYDRSSVGMLDEAARGDLLTRTEGEQAVRERGSERSAVRRHTATYAPTASGAPFFRAVERRTGSGMLPFPAVCGARGEIVDIVRWTEPADVFGQRISQVTYTSRGVDPYPLWSEADRAAAAKPVERTVPLALASDGWRPMPR